MSTYTRAPKSARLEGRGAIAQPDFTISVAFALRATLPLVPVTVKVKVPRGVEEDVRIARVELFDALTGLGLKVAVEPEGSPAIESATSPAKPPWEETLTV